MAHILSAPADAFRRLAHWLIRWLSEFPGSSALTKTRDLRSENVLASQPRQISSPVEGCRRYLGAKIQTTLNPSTVWHLQIETTDWFLSSISQTARSQTFIGRVESQKRLRRCRRKVLWVCPLVAIRRCARICASASARSCVRKSRLAWGPKCD